MSAVCNYCGCSEIEYDQSRGDAVCTGCGSVLEDNIIVSEVNFQEQPSGANTVIGQFVSEGGKPSLNQANFGGVYGRDAKDATALIAKKRIASLGNRMKLNQHCIDTAFRFFKMALAKGLTRGTKATLVDTACLYLVCRTEGTSHLLLDFSDLLQINVYALGRAYLKLSNALHINPPALDPCLYIHRFAHKLEFKAKTQDVSVTALRLVSRMKRDWISAGRRPAGLCGAALLVAARMHNFNRTIKDVSRVVRVNDQTIRKRLNDFKDTPTSSLTINQFLEIDLEHEHDPPSFIVSKKRVKKKSVKLSIEGQTSGESEEREGEWEEEEGEFCFTTTDVPVLPVNDVIARAKFEEMFHSVPTAGLTEDLHVLVNLTEETMSEDQLQSNPPGVDGQLDLEGIDDEEIDKMLLTEEEVRIKTKLWMTENEDYLKEMEAKRLKQEAAMLLKRSKKKKDKLNKQRRKGQTFTPASSAGEAIQKMLIEKRISNKINYDVLKDLAENSINSDFVDSGLPRSSLQNTGFGAVEHQSNFSSDSTSQSLDQGFTHHTTQVTSLITRKRPFIAASTSQQHSSAKKYSSMKHHLESDDVFREEEPPTAPVCGQLIDALIEEESDSLPGMELVVESGPVDYEDIITGEDEGKGDVVMDGYYDDLAYPGDPLLQSDGEDESEHY